MFTQNSMHTLIKWLSDRLATMYSRVVTSHGSGWSQVLEELARLDFAPFHDQWLLDGCSLQSVTIISHASHVTVSTQSCDGHMTSTHCHMAAHAE